MTGPLPEPATALPPGLSSYKRTPDFTAETIPAGLLKAHSTKEGVWGLIQVTEGRLVYRVLEKRQPREFLLTPGAPGVVEPTVEHEVQPSGPVWFFVEFFRQTG